ncbi:MAG TPA: hypothetical protein V6D19_23330 [Stenomitos sp.]
MKLATAISIVSALYFGTALPTLAQGAPAPQLINGQVESVDGTILTLKTDAGDTKIYRVDPSLVSSLKLGPGSSVVIDNSRLLTGKLVRLDTYTAEVELDNGGDQKSYILTREGRRYLTVGDRVVITPDLRVVRADLYTLTASDLRLQAAAIASSASMERQSSRQVIRREVEIRRTETPTPVSQPVESETTSAPVGGLW